MSIIVQMGKKATSLFSLIFLVSCAQIELKTPSARFISPESSGRSLAYGFQMMQQSGTEAKVNIVANELDKVELSNTASPLAFSGYVGVLENLDIIYYNYVDSASMLGVKYQIFGDSKEKAKEGSKSLSVTLGGGGQTQTTTSDNIFDEKVDETELDQNLVDASVIYGYRIKDYILLYSSFHISNHTANLKIVSNSDPALDGASETYATTNYGLSLGSTIYTKNKKAHLSIEASAQRVNWTHSEEKTFGYISGALGFDF
jgi:hypothetical protein